MGFLKGLTLTLLSLLLFLSVSVFTIAFALNSTALNTDFLNEQIDQLNISAIVDEVISQQTDDEEGLPQSVQQALTSTLPEVEQELKTAVGNILDDLMNYLKIDNSSINLKLALEENFLNADFIISVIDKFELSVMVEDIINEQFFNDLPQDMTIIIGDPGPVVSEILSELEPWLRNQVEIIIPPVMDYILGNRQEFSIIIPLDVLKETTRATLWAEYGNYFDSFMVNFPASVEINEETIGAEIPANFSQALTDAEESLAEAKKYVGWFLMAYWAVIGLILVAIVCIILINRDVKKSSRSLGVFFLVFGVMEYIGVFVTKSMSESFIPSDTDIPVAVQSWLPQFIENTLKPLEMLAIGFTVIGVVLVIVPILYKRSATKV